MTHMPNDDVEDRPDDEVVVESEFEPSDFVQLRLGGPRMIVDSILPNGDVCVFWWSMGELKTTDANPAVLQPYVQQPAETSSRKSRAA